MLASGDVMPGLLRPGEHHTASKHQPETRRQYQRVLIIGQTMPSCTDCRTHCRTPAVHRLYTDQRQPAVHRPVTTLRTPAVQTLLYTAVHPYCTCRTLLYIRGTLINPYSLVVQFGIKKPCPMRQGPEQTPTDWPPVVHRWEHRRTDQSGQFGLNRA